MKEQFILAKYIELKRKELGLTQSQVAQILGMPRTTYQVKEVGRMLDIAFLRMFSERVLKIDFTEFISRYEYFRRCRENQL